MGHHTADRAQHGLFPTERMCLDHKMATGEQKPLGPIYAYMGLCAAPPPNVCLLLVMGRNTNTSMYLYFQQSKIKTLRFTNIYYWADTGCTCLVWDSYAPYATRISRYLLFSVFSILSCGQEFDRELSWADQLSPQWEGSGFS